MKYFVPPISRRERDKRVTSLIREGQATDDQLFEAQYGEWPAKGLHKDTPCDDVVLFKGLHRDKKLNPLSYVFNLAYTREDSKEREIYINNLLMSPAGPVLGFFATRQAFARAHDLLEVFVGVGAPFAIPELMILTALSSYRYAFASSMTKLLAPSIADVIGEEQIHVKQFNDGQGTVANAAFQGLAQDWFSNQSDLKKARISTLQGIDALLTLMPRQYYAADPELQSRMHNVMVRGYESWGKLPENQDELYAALLDMGIKAPDLVKDYCSQEDQGYLKETFDRHASWEQGLLSPPNAEMNLGLNSYRDTRFLHDGKLWSSGEILEMYWRDCIPFLYADLLVKYGDSRGLERFGYSDEVDLYGIPIKSDLPNTPS